VQREDPERGGFAFDNDSGGGRGISGETRVRRGKKRGGGGHSHEGGGGWIPSEVHIVEKDLGGAGGGGMNAKESLRLGASIGRVSSEGFFRWAVTKSRRAEANVGGKPKKAPLKKGGWGKKESRRGLPRVRLRGGGGHQKPF